MKAIKVEVVWKADEKAVKEEERAWEKAVTARTPNKSRRFLAGQDKEITSPVMDMLPSKVRGATANF